MGGDGGGGEGLAGELNPLPRCKSEKSETLGTRLTSFEFTDGELGRIQSWSGRIGVDDLERSNTGAGLVSGAMAGVLSSLIQSWSGRMGVEDCERVITLAGLAGVIAGVQSSLIQSWSGRTGVLASIVGLAG